MNEPTDAQLLTVFALAVLVSGIAIGHSIRFHRKHVRIRKAIDEISKEAQEYIRSDAYAELSREDQNAYRDEIVRIIGELTQK